MDVTIMRRVVPMVGVFAMLLALLVPHTTALADDNGGDPDETGELDPEESASPTVETSTEGSTASPTTGTADTTEDGASTPTTGTTDTADSATPTTDTVDTTEDVEVTETTETVDTTGGQACVSESDLADSKGAHQGDRYFSFSYSSDGTGEASLKQDVVLCEDVEVTIIAAYWGFDGKTAWAGDGQSLIDKNTYTIDNDNRSVTYSTPGWTADSCGQNDIYLGWETVDEPDGRLNGGLNLPDRLKDPHDPYEPSFLSDYAVGGHSPSWTINENCQEEVELKVTFMCAAPGEESNTYVMRVKRFDDNTNVTAVPFAVYDNAGQTGTPTFEDPDGTALAGKDDAVYFEVADKESYTVFWGGENDRIAEDDHGTATAGDDNICHFEVTPEKEFVGGFEGDFEVVLSSDDATTGSDTVTITQDTTDADSVKVAIGGSYSVSEPSMADGFVNVEGVGTFDVPETPKTDAGDIDWASFFQMKKVTHTVTNAYMPELTFQKIICDDYSQVRGHPGSSPDDTDGNFVRWGTAEDVENLGSGDLVTSYGSVEELPSGCSFADGPWTFEVSFNQNFTGGPIGTVVTGDNGTVTLRADQVFDELEDAVKFVDGTKLWVKEEMQDGFDFGALQCYDDALNPDNLEGFSISNPLKGDIACVAFNVTQQVPVLPDKVWNFGDAETPEGSATIFAEIDDEQVASWTFQTMDTWALGDEDAEPQADVPSHEPVFVPVGAEVEFSEEYDVDGWSCEFEVLTPDEFFDRMNSGQEDLMSPAEVDIRPSKPGMTTHYIVNTCTEEDDTPPPTTTPQTPPETDVEGETFEPAATIVDACIVDDELGELLEVTITLDNTESTDTVTFEVFVDGFRSSVEVEGGETEVLTEAFPADLDRDVDVTVIAGEGDPLAEASFDPDACAVEVEGEVVEDDDPTDEPTDEPSDDPEDTVDEEVDVEVLGVTESQPETPRTGASAILLTLMGLLSVAVGGGMLRTRRRQEG